MSSGGHEPVLLVEVTRAVSGVTVEPVESRHYGHAVLVDQRGSLLASLGNPEEVIFPRSAVKPFQLETSLRILGEAADELTSSELAVGWSSHYGERAHLDAVESILRRAGRSPDELTCPMAPPKCDLGAPSSRLTHNCSGKHAMFALAGAVLGLRAQELLDPALELQQRILQSLDEVLGGLSGVGVDGCGAPAVAAPLRGLGRAFADLAIEERYQSLREAAWQHPTLVSGTGTLGESGLRAGAVIKSGAEGVYGAGWIGPDSRSYGVAVKTVDGSHRGSECLIAAVLQHAELAGAAPWSPAPPFGGEKVAGSVRLATGVAPFLETVAAHAAMSGA